MILWCISDVLSFLFHFLPLPQGTFQVSTRLPHQASYSWIACLASRCRLATASQSSWITRSKSPFLFSIRTILLQEFSASQLPWWFLAWGLSWQWEATKVSLSTGAWLSVGRRARGHTVGPEPSRMSPQSGFWVRGDAETGGKVLRAKAGAGWQCVWVRQMRGSEVIAEWCWGGWIEAGWLTRGSRAWLSPGCTTGRQLVLDTGRNPGNSSHCSSCRESKEKRRLVGNGIYWPAFTSACLFM